MSGLQTALVGIGFVVACVLAIVVAAGRAAKEGRDLEQPETEDPIERLNRRASPYFGNLPSLWERAREPQTGPQKPRRRTYRSLRRRPTRR